jgi:hypothetical protein
MTGPHTNLARGLQAFKSVSPTMPADFFGCLSLWQYPEGDYQIAKLFLDDSEIQWSSTHVYYAIFPKPSNPIGEVWMPRVRAVLEFAKELELEGAVRHEPGHGGHVNTYLLVLLLLYTASARTVGKQAFDRCVQYLFTLWKMRGCAAASVGLTGEKLKVLLDGEFVNLQEVSCISNRVRRDIFDFHRRLHKSETASSLARCRFDKFPLPELMIFLARFRATFAEPIVEIDSLVASTVRIFATKLEFRLAACKDGGAFLSDAFPENGRAVYEYGSDKRGWHCTRPDPQLSFSKKLAAEKSPGVAPPKHMHSRDNVLQLAKTAPALRRLFERHGHISLVGDSARFADASSLVCFASCPESRSESLGLVVPVQILPECHSDFRKQPLGVRLLGAMMKKVVSKPKSDPLQPTWEHILSLHNCLKPITASGLLAFKPLVRSHPMVHPGSYYFNKETRTA